MSSSRRMSDTNLELANHKLRFAMSNVGDSSSTNKRPSQSSNQVDQAMTTLLAMDRQNGPLRSGQISTHAPDRAVATDSGLRPLPGSDTAPDHAQSQRGSQRGTGVDPPHSPGLPQPVWLPNDRYIGGARRLTTNSETIPAVAVVAAAGPLRHRYHTCSAVLRGMLRKRVVAPDDETLSGQTARALPTSAQSNWIDSTEDETSSGQRMSKAGQFSGATQVRTGSSVCTGKLNKGTRRPSLSKSASSFVVDQPATDVLDPDNLRLQKTGRWYVLHPMSRYRVVWDYLLVALVLASALAVPLQLAFCDETSAALATPGTSLNQPQFLPP